MSQMRPGSSFLDSVQAPGFNFERLRLEDSTDRTDTPHELCPESLTSEILTDSLSAITASAEPSSVKDSSVLDESRVAFAGFNSGELTASELDRKYEWLDKKKSCVMIDKTPRQARSMDNIILTFGGNGNLTQHSVYSTCTVKQAPISDNVPEPLVGRSNSCDDLPQSSATSGESPDSFQSSVDLARESFDPLAETPDSGSSRNSEERSPTGRLSTGRALATPDLNCVVEESDSDSESRDQAGEVRPTERITLIPGKKYRRSLVTIRNSESHQVIPKVNIGNVTGLSTWRPSTRQSSHMSQMRPGSSFLDSVQAPGDVTGVSTWRPSTRQSSHMSQMTPGSSFQDSVQASVRPDEISPASIGSPEAPLPYPTALDALFGICNQKDFVEFSSLLSPESYERADKIGEGVYGEVFSVNRGDCMTVLKIIPLEGNFKVNDAEQKTYEEILPELLISLELNYLRDGQVHRNYHKTDSFVEIRRICLARGRYTPELLDLWTEFDVKKRSDNDNPSVFDDNQIYAVIEQANGGSDLEHYKFSTALQAVSVFKQTVFALAVAECAIEFEHRDLHWGNVLVSKSADKKIFYQFEEEPYAVLAYGVKATIIDYTLSRITLKNTHPMFSDLSKDPDLFRGSGDYQFEVYRQMKSDVNNDWVRHVPKTNVRWLHYLVLKMQQVKFLRETPNIHKESMKILRNVPSWVEMCESATDVAKELVKRKV